MKIGIVTTTVREGRASINVANWVLEHAKKNGLEGVEYELVDLKDYQLPFLGQGTEAELAVVGKWVEKMTSLDGFIFVTAEYNRAPSGVFKNALDYLKAELTEKPVSFVGYGSLGGARSIEQLRQSLATISVPTPGIAVNLLLAIDFENWTVFKPQEHQLPALQSLFVENYNWAKAFKSLRESK